LPQVHLDERHEIRQHSRLWNRDRHARRDPRGARPSRCKGATYYSNRDSISRIISSIIRISSSNTGNSTTSSNSGIEIVTRVEIPEELIPADARVPFTIVILGQP